MSSEIVIVVSEETTLAVREPKLDFTVNIKIILETTKLGAIYEPV